MARRAKGEGSIYKHGNYYVGQYFVDGKKKDVYGKTQKEAKEKLDKAIEKIKNKIDMESENLTLIQWLNEWLNTYAENDIKQSTYISYEGIIRRHVGEHRIGGIKLADLTTANFQSYFNDKKKQGRADGKAGGLAPKTIKNHYNMIHEALEQAITNRLIMSNPIEGVRLPRQQPKEMRVLDMTEQKRLMNFVGTSETIGDCGINIALLTGMRLGELAGLQWQDIDWENKQLHVKRTINRLKSLNENSPTKTEIVISDPKTSNSIRTIPMISQLVELLKKQYGRQKELAGYIDKELPSSTHIVTNSSLKFYEPRTYEDLFNGVMESTEIKNATMHTLRHTFATRCIENGMDIVVLSKILGHASPSTTMNKYGHALKEQKIASMEKMESTFSDMTMFF